MGRATGRLHPRPTGVHSFSIYSVRVLRALCEHFRCCFYVNIFLLKCKFAPLKEPREAPPSLGEQLAGLEQDIRNQLKSNERLLQELQRYRQGLQNNGKLNWQGPFSWLEQTVRSTDRSFRHVVSSAVLTRLLEE